MKYLSKSFSVAFEGDAYRAGFDLIDWAKKCSLCGKTEGAAAQETIPCPACILKLENTPKCKPCRDTGMVTRAMEGVEFEVPCTDCRRRLPSQINNQP